MAAVNEFDEKSQALRTEKIERGELPPNFPAPYLGWQELRLDERQYFAFSDMSASDNVPRLPFGPAPVFGGQLPVFIKKTAETVSGGKG